VLGEQVRQLLDREGLRVLLAPSLAEAEAALGGAPAGPRLVLLDPLAADDPDALDGRLPVATLPVWVFPVRDAGRPHRLLVDEALLLDVVRELLGEKPAE